MKYDVVSLGEVLIDLTQTGAEKGVPQYAANPGGAPANAAVAAARMGCETAFIGRVGADAFGLQLRAVLEKDGIDLSGLSVDEDIPTTLAVVSVNETGERSFRFYRSPGADVMLRREHIPNELLENCRFLHFGSVSLTADPSRSAVLEAVKYAKEHGAIISYDPNFRPALWKDIEEAADWMRKGVELADIVKISDEEAEIITGFSGHIKAGETLIKMGAKLALISMGAEGAYFRAQGGCGTVPGFSVKVADTNGAGDTFLGATLSRLAELGKPLDDLSQDELKDVVRFANRAASLTASRPGAIPAIATLDEVQKALEA